MIEQYLNPYEFTSKQEISAKTGLSEREVRRKISELKLTKAVLYNSQTKGHRLRKTNEQLNELNTDKLLEEKVLNSHSIKDIQARIRNLENELDSYFQYNEDIDRVFYRKSNEEFYGR